MLSPQFAIFLSSLLLSGCATPVLVWNKTEHSGPIAFGKVRADVLAKCDMSPAFMSDVVACEWAFVDLHGKRIDVESDVQAVLDDFMPSVGPLRQWVKVANDRGSPASPSGNVVPYRLHLITISPVVLLAVPRQPSQDHVWCTRWPRDGCIPSRRFDLETYLYHAEPAVAKGAFWIVPSQGISSKTVNDVFNDVFLDLPDSRIRLTPVKSVWQVSREARTQ